MRKIIIILFVLLVSLTAKAQTPPITDTLQWLRTNIGQRNSYFNGKPFRVLLDSLYGLKTSLGYYISTSEYAGFQNVGDSSTATSVYTKYITIVVGAQLGEIKPHRMPTISIVFSQKIPFPITLLNDRISGLKWGTMIETLCKYQIVESVQIGEY